VEQQGVDQLNAFVDEAAGRALRTELADVQSRRETISARAGRIGSVLQEAGRFDPAEFEQAASPTCP
jgi:hypothetical protein